MDVADLSERSSTENCLDRAESSESGITTELEHRRSRNMADVAIPHEKEKSKKLSSRVARGIKKTMHKKEKKSRSLSPHPENHQQSLSSIEEADLLGTPLAEPKKKHKNNFKPIAKAAAAAARKISGKSGHGSSSSSSSNRDRTQSWSPSPRDEISSQPSSPTNMLLHRHHVHLPELPLGKTPVNTPVSATNVLTGPIPEEIIEELQNSSANVVNTNDPSEEPSERSTTQSQSYQNEASIEFESSPGATMDDASRADVHSVTQPPELTEDEMLKLAEAMALAVKDNPNMSHEEIRRMVLSQPEFQHLQQQPGNIIPLAAAAAAAANSSSSSTTNSSGKSTKTLLQKNFKTFKEQFAGGITTGRDKFKEIMGSNLDLGGSMSALVYSSKTTPRQQGATITTDTTDSEGVAATVAAAGTMTGLDVSSLSAGGALSLQNSSASVTISPGDQTGTAEGTSAPMSVPTDLVPEKSDEAGSASAIPPPVAPASASAVADPAATTNKLEPPIRLTDIVWKRRSGWGKYSTSDAWERRRMVLRGSQLLYYKAKGEADDSAGALDGDFSQQQQQAHFNASASTLGTSEKVSKPSGGSRMMDALERASNSLGLSSSTQSSAVPSTKADARGHLDLVKEGATVSATTGHSGAPSPFCLSIKVRGETKWKLCFASHKTQMEWLAALTDLAVQASVDAYNAELLSAADPSNPGLSSALYHNHVFEPSGDGDTTARRSTGHVAPEVDDTLPQPMLQSSGHRLWMMEPYVGQLGGKAKDDSSTGSVGSGTDDSELFFEDELIPLTSSAGDVGMRNSSGTVEDEEAKFYLLPERNLQMAAFVVNAAILYARNSSMSVQGFWTTLVVANMTLLVCLQGAVRHPSTSSDAAGAVSRLSSRVGLRGRMARKRKGKKGGTGSGRGNGANAGTRSKGDASGLKAKSQGFIPMAGMSTLKIENPTDLPINAKGQVFAGWRARTGGDIRVRSHGYLETKVKIPSPGTLYELNEMDIFESPSRYPDMAPRVKLPKLTYEVDPNETKTWRAPDYFVISVALPTDPPKMGKTSSDGGGYTLTMYFTMKKETREILKRVTAEDYNPAEEPPPADKQKSIVNACRLLDEWCRRAAHDLPFQTRFKMIPYVENAKEIGLPSWINKYNATPLLIKRPGQTGFLFMHPEMSCIEFDISLHVFPYLAKQGICYLKDSMFKKILASVAFVIEGRHDDELPECLIGVVQVCYPDPQIAIQASDFFAGTAPRSFEPEDVKGNNPEAPTIAAAHAESSIQAHTAVQSVPAL